MRKDPAEAVTTSTVRFPPAQGRGAGKEAWKALATSTLDANESLSRVIDDQRALIRELQAEVKLLREQIASRKPKGGRERLSDETVDGIERALASGQSTRRIASTWRVSAMTVSRVKKRQVARQAQFA
jgi:DNA invertase Pin-like site-specific DNA recombinase